MRAFAVPLLVLCGAGFANPAIANEQCGPVDGVKMAGPSDSPWVVRVNLKPKVVPLNQPFGANITICSKTNLVPVQMTVDATMPAHKHGMNYKSKTVRVGNHRYEVDNLLFHMPGLWRLQITVYDNDTPYRFTHDVSLR